jgi:thiol-disulfide isomerase/thioredoxin
MHFIEFGTPDEGLAVRVVPCVLVMLAAICLQGCKSLGKKDGNAASNGGKANPDAALARNPERPGTAFPPAPAPERTVSAPAGASGVLAGQVLDSASHRLPNAFIQVSEAGDAGRRGAPVEVAADNQGYFLIQGVQAGRRYQLTARARDGSRALTGSVWATPPDPKLVICLNDDAGVAPTAERGWSPAPAPVPGPRRAAELGPPTGAATPWPPMQPAAPSAVPAPDPPPAVGADPLEPRSRIRPQDTAQDTTAAQDEPPPAAIRPGPASPAVGGWAAPAAAATPLVPAPQFGPPRVPSCVLTGQTCYNFALNDLSGQPWEFRQRRGRLILVDFWGTWCVHCMQAVPSLNMMQERYGPFGLEVVGIAYESGTPAEQTRKVNDVRQRMQINYRVLLGSERETCPVRRQFGVKAWPTMVLLDDTGRIIWRGEGFDQQHVRELEVVIRQRLAQR